MKALILSSSVRNGCGSMLTHRMPTIFPSSRMKYEELCIGLPSAVVAT